MVFLGCRLIRGASGETDDRHRGNREALAWEEHDASPAGASAKWNSLDLAEEFERRVPVQSPSTD